MYIYNLYIYVHLHMWIEICYIYINIRLLYGVLLKTIVLLAESSEEETR